MSIQVLNLAAMGDTTTNNRLLATASHTANGTSGSSAGSLGRAASPNSLAPYSLSNAAGNDRSSNSSSPLLSAIVARNAAQWRALSANGGLFTAVSQESQQQLERNQQAHAASGIVSHLRAASAAVNNSTARQDIETVLRAKAAASAASGGNSSLLAFQRAYAASPRLSSNILPPSRLSAFAISDAMAPSLSSLAANGNNAWLVARLAPSLASLKAHQNAFLGKQMAALSEAHLMQQLAYSGKSVPAPLRSQGPTTLFMECDEDSLSEYQCLIRQQMELFAANSDEAAASVQGRNKQIVPGQVGIRCKHCAHLPARRRAKGSMYFPTKLDRIYQAAQNLSAFHLCDHCPHVPAHIRKQILVLRERKSPAGGGKQYWAEGVRCLGVLEDPRTGGLCFK